MPTKPLTESFDSAFLEELKYANRCYNEAFGTEYNLNICMEEPAELIQAISKCRRDMTPKAKDHLAEEIGDTIGVIIKLCQIYDISSNQITNWMRYKMERGMKAVEENKKNGKER